MAEQLLTIQKVAELWSVNERTVRREISRGELRTIRVGRVVRITETAVRDYLRSHSS